MWRDFQCYWCGALIEAGEAATTSASWGPVHPWCWLEVRLAGRSGPYVPRRLGEGPEAAMGHPVAS
jgi:hypothetical protein